jgi:hypothetical protein
MIICDVCKQDPIETAVKESLKRYPWGITINPPPDSGLSARNVCWVCTLRVVDQWIKSIEVKPPDPKTY